MAIGWARSMPRLISRSALTPFAASRPFPSGVEGGFDVGGPKYNYTHDYSIVVLPEGKTYALDDPSVPETVRGEEKRGEGKGCQCAVFWETADAAQWPLQWPVLPLTPPPQAKLAAAGIIAADSASMRQEAAAWEEERPVST